VEVVLLDIRDAWEDAKACAHGYVFRASCDEKGWVNADCYRLRFKTEGR
jgi:hypothetical protein